MILKRFNPHFFLATKPIREYDFLLAGATTAAGVQCRLMSRVSQFKLAHSRRAPELYAANFHSGVELRSLAVLRWFISSRNLDQWCSHSSEGGLSKRELPEGESYFKEMERSNL
jgi:hypothetical protein